MSRLCISCKDNGVKKYATFGYDYQQPKYCKTHKPIDCYNVINKRCIECPSNRPTVPVYGYEAKKPIYCKQHAPNDAINVMHKRCETEKCSKLATYGNEWLKPKYCKYHMTTEMVDVVNKRCKYKACEKRPTYGYDKPLYCIKHKTTDMIDVVNQMCKYGGCKVRATFGHSNNSPLFCKLHSMKDMKDVVNKVCAFKDCHIHPSFGFDEVKYCKDHALDGMENLVSKRCETNECHNIAIYGKEINKPQFCKTHKTDKHINCRHIKCLEEHCEKRASFGLVKFKPIYCSQHKLDTMSDVIKKKCSVCWDTQVSNSRYDGMCFYCYCQVHPDIPIFRQYKTKQAFINEQITKDLQHLKDRIRYDKIIDGGCSIKQPDWFIECYTHAIIIECDENQHKHISDDCEQIRLNNIFIDLAERPLVIIRFNPDKYTNYKGIRIPGVFTFSNTGRIQVNDNEWTYRYKYLLDKVQYYTTNIPKNGFTYEFLFYDEDR